MIWYYSLCEERKRLSELVIKKCLFSFSIDSWFKLLCHCNNEKKKKEDKVKEKKYGKLIDPFPWFAYLLSNLSKNQDERDTKISY